MGRGKVPTGGVIGFFCGHAHDAVDMENPQTPSPIITCALFVCDVQNGTREGYTMKQSHHSAHVQLGHMLRMHTAFLTGAAVGATVKAVGSFVGGAVVGSFVFVEGAVVGALVVSGSQHSPSHGTRCVHVGFSFSARHSDSTAGFLVCSPAGHVYLVWRHCPQGILFGWQCETKFKQHFAVSQRSVPPVAHVTGFDDVTLGLSAKYFGQSPL